MPRTNCDRLAALVTTEHGGFKNKTKELIIAIFKAAQAQLQTGNEVYIRGFGKFEVTNSAARAGVHPRTGEAMQIPARKRVKFRPSINLLGDAQ